MNAATTSRCLLALILLAASLSAAHALECGSSQIFRCTDRYDALNRLVEAENLRAAGQPEITRYTYDGVGNLANVTLPNQVQTAYTYNPLNRLTEVQGRTAGGLGNTVARYQYTLGAAGNRTGVVEHSGRTVGYTYDSLYRLTRETIQNANTSGQVDYTYDPVGNRLTRASNITQLPDQTQGYDANDRLTSDTYDANGNTTLSSGKSYQYDSRNRLKLLTENGETQAGYVYDGDGNLVSKTAGGVTVSYLVDELNLTGYAQVLEEHQAGALSKIYTFGLDLICQDAKDAGGNWAIHYYGYDGHGTVRYLTDATGMVTDTYDYDAFGVLIDRTGSTDNSFLYCGERWDANLGFYYLRARYMNPGTGRFWTMDSYEGDPESPLSLHRYLYTHSNPINGLDPSGNMTVLEGLCVTGIVLLTVAKWGMIAVGIYQVAKGILAVNELVKTMQFMWQMAKTTADLILLEILRRELLLGSIQNLQEAVMLGVGLTLLFVSQAVNLGSEAYGVSQAKLPSMFSALRRLFRQKAPGGGQSPRRLVAGGGHADFMPGLQPDDISLNNDMDLRGPTLPDVKGDINAMPFRGGSFDDVCFERIQYEAFTGGNVGSLSEAARVLKPGGGLRIVTGANAPVKEIISALKELGFSVEKMQLGDSLEIVATLVK